MKKITITEEQFRRIVESETVNREALADFCSSGTDFLFAMYSPFKGGMKVRSANTPELQKTIADEVLSARGLEYSHDIDSVIAPKGMINGENCRVVKVMMPQETYYIVWDN